uniref:Uncharacterized protein n=1 Tax=Arundo donax TaxID=35708 RepID=A0A0A9D9C5_ARUDO
MSTGTLSSDAGKCVASPTPARSSIRVWNAMLSSLNSPASAKWRMDLARVASWDRPGLNPDRSTRYTGRDRDAAYAYAAAARPEHAATTTAALARASCQRARAPAASDGVGDDDGTSGAATTRSVTARRCGRRLTRRRYSSLAWFTVACLTVLNSSLSMANDRVAIYKSVLGCSCEQ